MANILIIDDDREIRTLLKDTLTKGGHEVDSAESGRAGLDSVGRRVPDLILLDLMMPLMNGYEFLDNIGR